METDSAQLLAEAQRRLGVLPASFLAKYITDTHPALASSAAYAGVCGFHTAATDEARTAALRSLVPVAWDEAEDAAADPTTAAAVAALHTDIFLCALYMAHPALEAYLVPTASAHAAAIMTAARAELPVPPAAKTTAAAATAPTTKLLPVFRKIFAQVLDAFVTRAASASNAGLVRPAALYRGAVLLALAPLLPGGVASGDVPIAVQAARLTAAAALLRGAGRAATALLYAPASAAALDADEPFWTAVLAAAAQALRASLPAAQPARTAAAAEALQAPAVTLLSELAGGLAAALRRCDSDAAAANSSAPALPSWLLSACGRTGAAADALTVSAATLALNGRDLVSRDSATKAGYVIAHLFAAAERNATAADAAARATALLLGGGGGGGGDSARANPVAAALAASAPEGSAAAAAGSAAAGGALALLGARAALCLGRHLLSVLPAAALTATLAPASATAESWQMQVATLASASAATTANTVSVADDNAAAGVAQDEGAAGVAARAFLCEAFPATVRAGGAALLVHVVPALVVATLPGGDMHAYVTAELWLKSLTRLSAPATTAAVDCAVANTLNAALRAPAGAAALSALVAHLLDQVQWGAKSTSTLCRGLLEQWTALPCAAGALHALTARALAAPLARAGLLLAVTLAPVVGVPALLAERPRLLENLFAELSAPATGPVAARLINTVLAAARPATAAATGAAGKQPARAQVAKLVLSQARGAAAEWAALWRAPLVRVLRGTDAGARAGLVTSGGVLAHLAGDLAVDCFETLLEDLVAVDDNAGAAATLVNTLCGVFAVVRCARLVPGLRVAGGGAALLTRAAALISARPALAHALHAGAGNTTTLSAAAEADTDAEAARVFTSALLHANTELRELAWAAVAGPALSAELPTRAESAALALGAVHAAAAAPLQSAAVGHAVERALTRFAVSALHARAAAASAVTTATAAADAAAAEGAPVAAAATAAEASAAVAVTAAAAREGDETLRALWTIVAATLRGALGADVPVKTTHFALCQLRRLLDCAQMLPALAAAAKLIASDTAAQRLKVDWLASMSALGELLRPEPLSARLVAAGLVAALENRWEGVGVAVFALVAHPAFPALLAALLGGARDCEGADAVQLLLAGLAPVNTPADAVPAAALSALVARAAEILRGGNLHFVPVAAALVRFTLALSLRAGSGAPAFATLLTPLMPEGATFAPGLALTLPTSDGAVAVLADPVARTVRLAAAAQTPAERALEAQLSNSTFDALVPPALCAVAAAQQLLAAHAGAVAGALRAGAAAGAAAAVTRAFQGLHAALAVARAVAQEADWIGWANPASSKGDSNALAGVALAGARAVGAAVLSSLFGVAKQLLAMHSQTDASLTTLALNTVTATGAGAQLLATGQASLFDALRWLTSAEEAAQTGFGVDCRGHVYLVCAGAPATDAAAGDETENEGVGGRTLAALAWLSLRELLLSLGQIFASPLVLCPDAPSVAVTVSVTAVAEARGPAGIFPVSAARMAGSMLLTTLLATKHMGVHEVAQTALETLVGALAAPAAPPAARAAARDWLVQTLEYVAASARAEDKSWIRRGAGLPFCVLALMRGIKAGSKSTLAAAAGSVDTAVATLASTAAVGSVAWGLSLRTSALPAEAFGGAAFAVLLALHGDAMALSGAAASNAVMEASFPRLIAAEASSAWKPRVHVLNLIRAVCRDRALSASLPAGVLNGAMAAALEGFACSNWNVRNAALLAFSAVSARMLCLQLPEHTQAHDPLLSMPMFYLPAPARLAACSPATANALALARSPQPHGSEYASAGPSAFAFAPAASFSSSATGTAAASALDMTRFAASFPGVLSAFARSLRGALAAPVDAAAVFSASSLAPILLVLSSLARPSADASAAGEAAAAGELRALVAGALSHSSHHIRLLAAKAELALTPVAAAPALARATTLVAMAAASDCSANAAHGNLLAAHALLCAIPAGDADAAALQALCTALTALSCAWLCSADAASSTATARMPFQCLLALCRTADAAALLQRNAALCTTVDAAVLAEASANHWALTLAVLRATTPCGPRPVASAAELGRQQLRVWAASRAMALLVETVTAAPGAVDASRGTVAVAVAASGPRAAATRALFQAAAAAPSAAAEGTVSVRVRALFWALVADADAAVRTAATEALAQALPSADPAPAAALAAATALSGAEAATETGLVAGAWFTVVADCTRQFPPARTSELAAALVGPVIEFGNATIVSDTAPLAPALELAPAAADASSLSAPFLLLALRYTSSVTAAVTAEAAAAEAAVSLADPAAAAALPALPLAAVSPVPAALVTEALRASTPSGAVVDNSRQAHLGLLLGAETLRCAAQAAALTRARACQATRSDASADDAAAVKRARGAATVGSAAACSGSAAALVPALLRRVHACVLQAHHQHLRHTAVRALRRSTLLTHTDGAAVGRAHAVALLLAVRLAGDGNESVRTCALAALQEAAAHRAAAHSVTAPQVAAHSVTVPCLDAVGECARLLAATSTRDASAGGAAAGAGSAAAAAAAASQLALSAFATVISGPVYHATAAAFAATAFVSPSATATTTAVTESDVEIEALARELQRPAGSAAQAVIAANYLDNDDGLYAPESAAVNDVLSELLAAEAAAVPAAAASAAAVPAATGSGAAAAAARVLVWARNALEGNAAAARGLALSAAVPELCVGAAEADAESEAGSRLQKRTIVMALVCVGARAAAAVRGAGAAASAEWQAVVKAAESRANELIMRAEQSGDDSLSLAFWRERARASVAELLRV